jgi:(p)ppGpp synthase/HD superfamily hydrolase
MTQSQMEQLLSNSGTKTKITQAIWLCKKAHSKQMRKYSEEPYFMHCLRVAMLTKEFCTDILRVNGLTLDDYVITALLHDVIEDTDMPDDILFELFGWIVADGVEILSHSNHITKSKKNKDDYYDNLSKYPDWVKIIKCSDRIDNITDLHKFDEEYRNKRIDDTLKYVWPLSLNFPTIERMLMTQITKFRSIA